MNMDLIREDIFVAERQTFNWKESTSISTRQPVRTHYVEQHCVLLLTEYPSIVVFAIIRRGLSV